MNCPSCQLVVSDSARFCANCGFSLQGVEPRPGWVRANIDLRAVATGQRRVIWLILAQIVFYFAMVGMRSSLYGIPGIEFAPGIIYIAMLVTMVVLIWKLMAALQVHFAWRVIAAIFCVAPCVQLIVLLVVNSRATTCLQAAGLKVRLLGVSDEQLTRVLGSQTCHTCGYSLVGNVSGICPECGTRWRADA